MRTNGQTKRLFSGQEEEATVHARSANRKSDADDDDNGGWIDKTVSTHTTTMKRRKKAPKTLCKHQKPHPGLVIFFLNECLIRMKSPRALTYASLDLLRYYRFVVRYTTSGSRESRAT
jgi:hypothetical protein